MLDVHPLQHASHTWRDFFVHIATICVGLLIAIALEQTVEAMHRHHERTQLREALDRESHQILDDTQKVSESEIVSVARLNKVTAQISDALRDHHPVGPLAPLPTGILVIPGEPIFKAAKTTGTLALLSDDDVVAYGELDSIVTEAGLRYEHIVETRRATTRLYMEIAPGEFNMDKVLAHASPEELKQFYVDLMDMENATREYLSWCNQAHSVAAVLLRGERDMQKIEQVESDALHQH